MEQKTTYMNLQLLRHEMRLDVGADVINENFVHLDEKIRKMDAMLARLQSVQNKEKS